MPASKKPASPYLNADWPMPLFPESSAAINETHFQLYGAMEKLDQIFGEGYAANHPELLSAMLNATAVNLLTIVMRNHIAPPETDTPR